MFEHLKAALAGRYTLQREVGRGGMATVYLARDLRHDRPVALKVLDPELARALGPERFLREVRTTARLQHPHILPVLDSGTAAGQLWYTMPYVRGESLRDRLRREVQLPVEVAVDLARQVALALDYAHREGVVHRDLKPDNILLSEGQALLADFGVARALAAGSETQLTETGMALGTPAYMSPEQATAGQVDGRSDIYALGCVLYEMLAGEPPFTGPTPHAVLAKRVLEPVPHVRTLRESVPEAVEQAITRALAKAPADRFRTAAEFARSLTTGVVTRRPSRVPVVLGALALVALVATAAVVLESRLARPGTGPALAASDATRLAVLPFENLGDSADTYFADGVADAVRGKLIALRGLEVIARTSSMAYRESDKPPEEIARELGVRYLLTATVRWAKAKDGTSRVQVSPELVEVSDAGAPASKWQQPFDAALTDVFQVQADIAARVAQSLDLALGIQEQERLAGRPTMDLAAYDAFLKGEAVAHALTAEEPTRYRRAQAFYSAAVARDSAFGLAWARLANSHVVLYGFGSFMSAEAEAAERALTKAEHLAPDAPETHRARVEYEEFVRSDFGRALAAAEAGLALAPNHPELMVSVALQEAHLGRIDAAITRLMRARTVDPRSPIVPQYLGTLLCYQRRWSEARRTFEDAVSLTPDHVSSLRYLAFTYVAEGNLAGARRVLAAATPAVDRVELAALVAWDYELYWMLDEATQKQVLKLPPSAFADDRGAWSLARARLHHLRGDTYRARAYADSARIEYQARLRANPELGWVHMGLGLALAYLGRQPDAIDAAERGAAIVRDAFWGPQVQLQLVRVYLLVGEPEKALDRLEPLLKVPYWLSPGWLRIDPIFAPLRGNPRFERLAAGR